MHSYLRYHFSTTASTCHYARLGLSRTASQDQIKKKFYELAKKHHPDVTKGQDAELFKQMTTAYEVLSNPDERIKYDASRGYGAEGQQKGG